MERSPGDRSIDQHCYLRQAGARTATCRETAGMKVKTAPSSKQIARVRAFDTHYLQGSAQIDDGRLLLAGVLYDRYFAT